MPKKKSASPGAPATAGIRPPSVLQKTAIQAMQTTSKPRKMKQIHKGKRLIT
jgi:hypothetical protein